MDIISLRMGFCKDIFLQDIHMNYIINSVLP